MSQHDLDIANQGFPATRVDLNLALKALGSTSKGSSRPGTIQTGQFWIDDSGSPWILYQYDGAGDLHAAYIDPTNNFVIPWGAVAARVQVKTALYTVAATERGQLHTQSGTYTVTLPAAATVGAGWSITLHNVGSGTITIDGNDAETINGAETLALSTQYDGAHLISNGTNFLAVRQSAGGGGKVAQVVSTSTGTDYSTSSTSYVSGPSLAITPADAANKILVLIGTMAAQTTSSGGVKTYLGIHRDATKILENRAERGATGAAEALNQPLSMHVLDSPSTTSEVTYMLKIKVDAADDTILLNDNGITSITLMEIAG